MCNRYVIPWEPGGQYELWKVPQVVICLSCLWSGKWLLLINGKEPFSQIPEECWFLSDLQISPCSSGWAYWTAFWSMGNWVFFRPTVRGRQLNLLIVFKWKEAGYLTITEFLTFPTGTHSSFLQRLSTFVSDKMERLGATFVPVCYVMC